MANTDESHNGKLKGMTPEEILKVMSGGRGRNAYGPKVLHFVEKSDEAGVNVREAWPVEFGTKKGTALYQGFLGAAKKAKVHESDDGPIIVRKSDEDVYLFHKERVAALTPAE